MKKNTPMQRVISLARLVLAALTIPVWLGSWAEAELTLTAAGVARGYTLTTFADGFPTTVAPDSSVVGPFGLTVLPNGGVMVISRASSQVCVFATDSDGQHFSDAAKVAFTGPVYSGLTVLAGRVYTSEVNELNLDGTFKQEIVIVGVPGAGNYGVGANPRNGKLYVGSATNGGLAAVDPIAGTAANLVSSGTIDGLTVDPFGGDNGDGIVYFEFNSGIVGKHLGTGRQEDFGAILGGADGIGFGSGALAGYLFVNNLDGTVVELHIASKAQTVIASGGSRGDYVAEDPNGTLLLIQSDRILRLALRAAPAIVVEQPAGTALTSGSSTVDFGSVNLGSSDTRTFTVKNPGNAPLTLGTITFDGSNPGDFQVTASPTSPLAPAGSTTFTVSLTPGAAGPRSAASHLPNNVTGLNPFTIAVTGIGAAPAIVVEQPAGTALTSGSSTVDFASVNLGFSDTRTFTIRNPGSAALTLGTIFFDGANPADFQVTASPTSPLAPLGSTTFTVSFTPSTAGPRLVTLHIPNNSPGVNPFNLGLTGTGAAPAIVVEQPAGAVLTSGTSTVDFGSVSTASISSRIFTIKNTGAANLTLGAIFIDGTNSVEFVVTAPPTSPIPSGGSTTFTVRFSPGANGPRAAVLHIPSNAASSNPFNIALAGTGGDANVMTLTADGVAREYELTTFADGFPSLSGFGPFGIAVLPSGGVMVISYGTDEVCVFPTSADGQHFRDAARVPWVGSNTAALTTLNGKIYSADVHELKPDGTLEQSIVTVNARLGIDANALNNRLYVAGDGGIVEIDPVARTKSTVTSGTTFDGVTVDPAGAGGHGVVYGATYTTIRGYDLVTRASVFDSGNVAGGGLDGVGVGTGRLAGKLVVNTNFGQLIEIDIATKAQTVIASGGSRGDYVVQDLDGTLLITQSDRILRLKAPFTAAITVEERPGAPLESNESTVRFTSDVGASVSKTFTIKNSGRIELTLGSPAIDGTHGSDFAITAPPSSPVPVGGSTTFTVRFTPSAAGERSAVLHLPNSVSNPNVNPFNFNLVGDQPVSQAGTFYAFVDDSDHDGDGKDGYLRLALMTTGLFTARLWFEDIKYSFRGRFDESGNFSTTLGSPPFAVQLHIDPSARHASMGDYKIEGTLRGVNLVGFHTAFDKSQTVALAGLYTVLLKANDPRTTIPQGTGLGLMTVSNSGIVTLKGRLGDHAAFSGAFPLTGDGRGGSQFYIFDEAYGEWGLLAGVVGFGTEPKTHCAGPLSWVNGARFEALYYPTRDGYFEIELPFRGARYAEPAAGQLPLAIPGGAATVTLSGGSLASPIVKAVTLTAKNGTITVAEPNPEKLELKVKLATGYLSGSFVHPVSNRRTPIRGAIYQHPDALQAGAYFLGPVLGPPGNREGFSGNVDLRATP